MDLPSSGCGAAFANYDADIAEVIVKADLASILTNQSSKNLPTSKMLRNLGEQASKA